MKVTKIKSEEYGTSINYEIISLMPTATDINEATAHVKQTDSVHLILSFEYHDHDSFPVENTDKLNDLLKEIENNNKIESLCTDFHNNPLFNLDQIKLLLTPVLLKKIISSISSNNNLHGASFITDVDILIYNEEILNHVLSTPSLRKVLSECQPAKQVFPNSCTAHSIMKYLFAKEKPEMFSILTEMEIYREIWRACGEVADPAKIKIYLQSLDINLVLVEDTELVKQIIGNSSELNILYEYTKSLFDQNHHKTTGINEDSFPKNSALLIITGCGEHAIIAERLQDGKIILQDTYNSVERTFDTLESFKDSRLEKREFGMITTSTIPSIRGFCGLAFNFFNKNNDMQDNEQNRKSNILSFSN